MFRTLKRTRTKSLSLLTINKRSLCVSKFEEYDGPYELLNTCKDNMYWIRGMDIIPRLVSKEQIESKCLEFEELNKNN